MNPCNRIVVLALSLGLLAACQPDSSPTQASASNASVPVAREPAAPTEPTAAQPAIAVPGSLDDCHVHKSVSVRWNFNVTGKHPKMVDVYIGGDDADHKLFVTGSSVGDVATGPWTLPGSEFVLKDHSSNEELARIKIGGPACGG